MHAYVHHNSSVHSNQVEAEGAVWARTTEDVSHLAAAPDYVSKADPFDSRSRHQSTGC